MKAGEFMQIFELGKTFKDLNKPKRRRFKKDFDFDIGEIDMTLLLQKKLQEEATIKKFLEDYAKAQKKDDKKDGWSVSQIAVALWLAFPIIAPLYVSFILKPLLH